MRPRPEAVARLAALLALEAAALTVLRRPGRGPGAVDWAHLGRWLGAAPPEDAVVAVVRVVALALAGWLLASTVLYALARLTRLPGLIRATQRTALPAVRRLVDVALAASLAGGLVHIQPVAAQASPPIVVELGATTTTTLPAHLYVPVPAGDAMPTTTTTPTTSRPAFTSTTATAPPPPTPPSPAPLATARTHTVVPGDNLWTIAESELSRQAGRTPDHLAESEIRRYWLHVIDANRSRLRSGDPNLIYPGESVLCPPAA